MVKKFIYLCCLVTLLAGCAYSVYSNSYPHLKKIRVEAFENQSTDFEIGSKLLDQLSVEYRNDGRLKVVTVAPDCVLEGKIISYEEKIYSYDSSNQVQDYQLKLSVNLSFTDLVNNALLMDNKNITVTELYAVSSDSSARFKSKAEAEDELIKSLFKNLMQNTLETW